MEVNTLFRTGSEDLKEYLEENKVGVQYTASGSNKTWTIKKVKIRTEVPPDFVTGEAQTVVTLVIV